MIARLATGCSFINVHGAPPPCTDNYVLPIIDGVVVSGALVGIGVAYAGRDKNSSVNVLENWAAGMSVVPALPLAVSALYGLTKVSNCRAAKPRQPSTHPDAEPRQPSTHPDADGASARLAARNRASTLNENARVAARAGDCETVRRIHPQVLGLDADFHATVFPADVGISRCLEPAITAPPIAPAPAPHTPPPTPPVHP